MARHHREDIGIDPAVLDAVKQEGERRHRERLSENERTLPERLKELRHAVVNRRDTVLFIGTDAECADWKATNPARSGDELFTVQHYTRHGLRAGDTWSAKVHLAWP